MSASTLSRFHGSSGACAGAFGGAVASDCGGGVAWGVDPWVAGACAADGAGMGAGAGTSVAPATVQSKTEVSMSPRGGKELETRRRARRGPAAGRPTARSGLLDLDEADRAGELRLEVA